MKEERKGKHVKNKRGVEVEKESKEIGGIGNKIRWEVV